MPENTLKYDNPNISYDRDMFNTATGEVTPVSDFDPNTDYSKLKFDTPGLAGGNLGSSEHDEGISIQNAEHAEQFRAEDQSRWEQAGNALVQGFVGTVIGGSIESVGYAADLARFKDIVSGASQEHANLFADAGKSMRSWTEREFPIYRDPATSIDVYGNQKFQPLSFSFWAQNFPSVLSTLSLMLPAVGMEKLAAGALKGVGLLEDTAVIAERLMAKGLSAVEVANSVRKIENLRTAGSGITQALFSRNMEDLQEGSDIYKSTFDSVYNQTHDLERAKREAASAAANGYKWDALMLMQDIPQYLLLGRMRLPKASLENGVVLAQTLKQSILPILAKQSYTVGWDLFTEGGEEAFQYIVSKEMQRMALRRLDPEKYKAQSLDDRIEAYSKDGELMTNFTMGVLGAGAMHGFHKAVMEPLANRGKETFEQQRLKNVLSYNSQYTAAIKAFHKAEGMHDQAAKDEAWVDLTASLGQSSVVNGNLNNSISFITRLANSKITEEDIAKEGGDPTTSESIKTNFEEIKKGLTTIGEKFEYYVDPKNGGFDIHTAAALAATEYKLETLSKKITDYKSNLEEKRKAIPGFYDLSPTGQELLETNSSIKAFQNRINLFTTELKSTNTSEAEKKGIQEQIRFEKEKLEELNNTLITLNNSHSKEEKEKDDNILKGLVTKNPETGEDISIQQLKDFDSAMNSHGYSDHNLIGLRKFIDILKKIGVERNTATKPTTGTNNTNTATDLSYTDTFYGDEEGNELDNTLDQQNKSQDRAFAGLDSKLAKGDLPFLESQKIEPAQEEITQPVKDDEYTYDRIVTELGLDKNPVVSRLRSSMGLSSDEILTRRFAYTRLKNNPHLLTRYKFIQLKDKLDKSRENSKIEQTLEKTPDESYVEKYGTPEQQDISNLNRFVKYIGSLSDEQLYDSLEDITKDVKDVIKNALVYLKQPNLTEDEKSALGDILKREHAKLRVVEQRLSTAIYGDLNSLPTVLEELTDSSKEQQKDIIEEELNKLFNKHFENLEEEEKRTRVEVYGNASQFLIDGVLYRNKYYEDQLGTYPATSPLQAINRNQIRMTGTNVLGEVVSVTLVRIKDGKTVTFRNEKIVDQVAYAITMAHFADLNKGLNRLSDRINENKSQTNISNKTKETIIDEKLNEITNAKSVDEILENNNLHQLTLLNYGFEGAKFSLQGREYTFPAGLPLNALRKKGEITLINDKGERITITDPVLVEEISDMITTYGKIQNNIFQGWQQNSQSGIIVSHEGVDYDVFSHDNNWIVVSHGSKKNVSSEIRNTILNKLFAGIDTIINQLENGNDRGPIEEIRQPTPKEVNEQQDVSKIKPPKQDATRFGTSTVDSRSKGKTETRRIHETLATSLANDAISGDVIPVIETGEDPFVDETTYEFEFNTDEVNRPNDVPIDTSTEDPDLKAFELTLSYDKNDDALKKFLLDPKILARDNNGNLIYVDHVEFQIAFTGNNYVTDFWAHIPEFTANLQAKTVTISELVNKGLDKKDNLLDKIPIEAIIHLKDGTIHKAFIHDTDYAMANIESNATKRIHLSKIITYLEKSNPSEFSRLRKEFFQNYEKQIRETRTRILSHYLKGETLVTTDISKDGGMWNYGSAKRTFPSVLGKSADELTYAVSFANGIAEGKDRAVKIRGLASSGLGVIFIDSGLKPDGETAWSWGYYDKISKQHADILFSALEAGLKPGGNFRKDNFHTEVEGKNPEQVINYLVKFKRDGGPNPMTSTKNFINNAYLANKGSVLYYGTKELDFSKLESGTEEYNNAKQDFIDHLTTNKNYKVNVRTLDHTISSKFKIGNIIGDVGETHKSVIFNNGFIKTNMSTVNNITGEETGSFLRNPFLHFDASSLRVKGEEIKRDISKTTEVSSKENPFVGLVDSDEIAFRLVEKGQLETKYTVQDIEKETQWLRDRLPGDSKITKDLLVQMETGRKGFGGVRNAAIILWEKAETGTAYHEAFHLVSLYYLNDEQRKDIYNAGRKLYGDNNLTDKEVDEKLAEDFRHFVMSEKSVKPKSSKIVEFFSNLYDWIYTLFTGKVRLSDNEIETLFRTIEKGKFKEAKIQSTNPNKFSNTTYLREIAGFTPEQSRNIIKNIVYQSIILNEIVTTFDVSKWEYAPVVEFFKDKIRQTQNLKLDTTSPFYTSYVAKQHELIEMYQRIVNNFDKFVEATNDYISNLNIRAKKMTTDDGENIIEETEIDEETGIQGVQYDKDSMEHNSKNNILANVKIFLATLPTGEVNSSTNLREFMDFSTAWSKIMNDTWNEICIEDILERLKVESQNNKAYETLLYGLRNKETGKVIRVGLVEGPEILRTQFWNALSRFKYNYISLSHRNNNSVHSYTLNPTSARQETLRRLSFWGDAFSRSSYINKENSTLFTKKIEKLIKVYGDFQTKITEEYINNLNKLPKLDAHIDTLVLYINSLGLGIDGDVINYIIKKHVSKDINTGFYDLVTGTSGFAAFIKALSRIADNEVSGLNKVTGDNINKIVSGNTFMRTLAEAQTAVSPLSYASSILGAGSNMYQLFVLPSYLTDTIKRIKKNKDEFIKFLKHPVINRNSFFIPQLLEAGNNFGIVTLSSYNNSAYKDLPAVDDFLTKFHASSDNIKTGREEYYIPPPTLADKGTYYFYTGLRKLDVSSSIYFDDEQGGKFIIPPNIVNVFKGYYENEKLRIEVVKKDVDDALLEEAETKNWKQAYQYLIKNIHYLETDSNGKPILETFQQVTEDDLTPLSKLKGKETFYTGNGTRFINFAEFNTVPYSDERLVKILKDRVLDTIHYATELSIIKSHNAPGQLLKLSNILLDSALVKTVEKTYNDKKISNELITTRSIVNLMADFTLNFIMSTIETEMIFSGDIAQAKDVKDNLKRMNKIITPGESLRARFKDGEFINRESYSVTTLKNYIHKTTDIPQLFKEQFAKSLRLRDNTLTEAQSLNLASSLLKVYKKTDPADGSVFITPKFHREILNRLGEWTPEMQSAYELLMSDKPLSIEEEFKLSDIVMQPLKLVYSGMHFVGPKARGLGVFVYDKMSMVTLFPRQIKDTALEPLYNRMINKDNRKGWKPIDAVKFESAVKSGDRISAAYFKGDDNPHLEALEDMVITNQHFRHLRRQQLTDPKDKEEINAGTQFKKAVPRLAEVLAPLWGSLSNKGKDILLDKITSDGKTLNKSKLYEILREAARLAHMPDSVVDNLITIGDNNTIKLHIDAFPNRKWIQSRIISLFGKHVIDANVRGDAFIQESSLGMNKPNIGEDSRLKLIDSKGRTELVVSINLYESVIPKNIYKDFTKAREWLLANKEILEGITYRIPSQGPNMLVPFVIVDVLPSYTANTVLVPYEFTTLTDSDFDIDKLYFMINNYNRVGDKLEKVQFVEPDEGNKITSIEKLRLLYRNDYGSKEAKLKRFKELKKAIESALVDKYFESESVKTYEEELKEELDTVSEVSNTFGIKDITVEKLDGLIKNIERKFITEEQYISKNRGGNVYDLNTKKAVQNKILDLYKKELTSKDQFSEYRIPLGYMTEKLKEIAANVNEWRGVDNTFKSLEVASPVHQMKAKNTFIDSVSGVGPFVLAQNHHALVSGTKTLTTDFYLGAGNKDRYGNTDFNQELGQDGVSITAWISAVITANVDALKDAYIATLNSCRDTWGAIATLLRAGVGEDTFKFIAQPVIGDMKDRSGTYRRRFEKNGRSWYNERYQPVKSTNDKINAITGDYEREMKRLMVVDKVKPSDIPIITNDQIFDPKILEAAFKVSLKDRDAKWYNYQLAVIKKFKQVYDRSWDLSASIFATQVDTKGYGNSFSTMRLYLDKINESINNEHVRGTYKLMDKTFLNTYKENAVDLALDLCGQLTLESSLFHNRLFNNLTREIGIRFKDRKTKDSITRGINDGIYASIVGEYYASKLGYDVTNESLNKLFLGDNTLVDQVRNIKMTHKELKKNFFLKQLDYYQGDKKVKYFEIPLQDKEDFEYENRMIDGWNELLTSPNESIRDLGKKLIIYAFYTTGGSVSKHSLWKYIPPQSSLSNWSNLAEGESFNDFIGRKLTELNNPTKASQQFLKIRKDFYQNNWGEDYLITKSLTSIENSQVTDEKGVELVVANEDFKTFTDERTQTGEFMYKPYILYGESLMEFVGYITKSKGDYLAMIPVYNKINKKGLVDSKQGHQVMRYGLPDRENTGYKTEEWIKKDLSEQEGFETFTYTEPQDRVISNNFVVNHDEEEQGPIIELAQPITSKEQTKDFYSNATKVPLLSREQVKQDSHSLYIFTDNIDRTSSLSGTNVDINSWYYNKYKDIGNISYGTNNNPTTARLRGLENTFPISTMKWFYKKHNTSIEKARWQNTDFELFKQTIDDELNTIQNALNSGKYNTIKVFHDQIGQGSIGQLTGEQQQYLDKKLNSLIGPVQPVEQKVADLTPSEYTDHAGGAPGSDSEWEFIGREYGVVNYNHYYYGEKTPRGNVELTKEQSDEGWKHVLEANKTLKRQPEKYRNLLSRNWFQVKNAEAIYAVGQLTLDTGIVEGGTGWAVQMALDNGKIVHIYDRTTNHWYVMDEDSISEEDTPTLTKNFAGIGTRGERGNIGDEARKAIRDVYNKTFGGNIINPTASGQLNLFEQHNNNVKEQSKEFNFQDNLKLAEFLGIPTENLGEMLNGIANKMGFETFAHMRDNASLEIKDWLTNGQNLRFDRQGNILSNVEKSGVDVVFDKNPELSKIGTKEQYSNYINTIFPDSVVKDIVYHGTYANFNDEFDKSQLGSTTGSGSYTSKRTGIKVEMDSSQAFFFTDNYNNAASYSFKGRHNLLTNVLGSLTNISLYKIGLAHGDRVQESLNYIKSIPYFKNLIEKAKSEGKTQEEIFALLKNERTRIEKITQHRDFSNYSNWLNNNYLSKKVLTSFYGEIDRFLKNDPTIKNEFGDFTTHSFGNDKYYILYDKKEGFSFRVFADHIYFSSKDATREKIKNFIDSALKSVEKSEIERKVEMKKAGYIERVIPAVLNIVSPSVKDYENSPFPDTYKREKKFSTKLPTDYVAALQVKKALKTGKDAIIYKNIVDPLQSNSYGVFDSKQIHILGSDKDVEGFKNYVSVKEQRTGESNNPERRNIMEQRVDYSLRVVDALSKVSRNKYDPTKLQGWLNDLAKFGVPKDQLDMFREIAKEGMSKDEIITALLANYGYTVDINIATHDVSKGERYHNLPHTFILGGKEFFEEIDPFVNRYYYTENGETVEIPIYDFQDAQEDWALKNRPRSVITNTPTNYYSSMTVPGGTNYTENEVHTPNITPSIKGHAQFSTDQGIGWFRSDEQIGNKPLTREQVEKQGGIYTDEAHYQNMQERDRTDIIHTKTRRVLEIQSDLFQKGRGQESLAAGVATGTEYNFEDGTTVYQEGKDYYIYDEEVNITGEDENGVPDVNYGLVKTYISKEDFNRIMGNNEGRVISSKTYNAGPESDNKFLQLLAKDNNWVSFFVKSIVQDSAKSGYEKVLFPRGETAAKVEGHETIALQLEKVNKQIKQLEEGPKYGISSGQNAEYGGYDATFNTLKEGEEYRKEYNITLPILKIDFSKEIKDLEQVKQNLKTEGLEKLAPIEAFYEKTIRNILQKNYKIDEITDEYGNGWYKVDLSKNKQGTILLQNNTRFGKRESLTRTEQKIQQFRKFIPFDVIIKYDNTIPSRAQWDRATRTLTFNTDLINKDTVGHEMFHILYDILQITNPTLIKQGLDLLINNSNAVRWVDKNYPELTGDDRNNEILAYAVSKEVEKLFVADEHRNAFQRWLMKLFYQIKLRLGITKDAVRRMAEMIVYKTNPIKVDQSKLNPFGVLKQDVGVDKIYEEIEKVDKEELSEKNRIREKIIAILTSQLGVTKRSSKSKHDIERLQTMLDDMMKSKDIMLSLGRFIQYAHSELFYQRDKMIEMLANEASGNKDAFTPAKLDRIRQAVCAFQVLDDIGAILQEMRLNTSSPNYKKNKKGIPVGRPYLKDVTDKTGKWKKINLISEIGELRTLRDDLAKQHLRKGLQITADFLAPLYGEKLYRFKQEAERKWNHLVKEGKTKQTLEDYIQDELHSKVPGKEVTYEEELKLHTRISIERELLKASKDINAIQRWMESIYDSSDAVVSASIKAFELKDYTSHIKGMKVHSQLVDAVRELEQFLGVNGISGVNVREFWDFMLEKNAQGIPTQRIIQEWKSEMYEDLHRVVEEARAKAKEYDWTSLSVRKAVKKAKSTWWSQNAPILPEDSKRMTKDALAYMKQLFEEKKITSADFKFFMREAEIHLADNRGEDNWDLLPEAVPFSEYGKRQKVLITNPVTGAEQLIERRNISEEAESYYNLWKHENISNYRTVNPKWINPDYAKIPTDPKDPRRKFYNLIVKLSNELESQMPYAHRLWGRLPGIEKTASERALEQGYSKATKIKLRDSLQLRPDDTERGSAVNRLELANSVNEPVHYQPVYYTVPVKEEDQSYDLATIYQAYFKMAIDFIEKFEIIPQMEMIKFFVTNRDYTKTGNDGKPILDSLSNKYYKENPGTPGQPRTSIELDKSSNLAKSYIDWFEAVLYGIRRKDTMGDIHIPFTGYKINIARAIDLMNSYTSIGMLGLNFIAGTANVAVGTANDFIEAMGGENFTVPEFASANAFYTMNLPKLVGDIGDRRPSNIINVLNETFDTLNEYSNGAFRENSVFKRLMHSDAFFFTMNIGEHGIQSTAMLAMLKHLRALDKEGKDIGDMLSHLKAKDGLMVVDEEVSNFGIKEQSDFKNKLKRMLASAQGEYYKNAQPAWSRYSLARMGMMFRKFLIPGIERRWGKSYYNNLSDKMPEGYYRSFYKYVANLITSVTTMGLSVASEPWTNLTEEEKGRVWKAGTEIMMLIAAIALAALFTSLAKKAGDDDDFEKWLINFMSYQTLRFRSEMSFYMWPGSAFQILRSPAAAVSMLQTAGELLSDLIHPLGGFFGGEFEFERYKIGPRKGQLKISKPLTDLIPLYKQYWRLYYIDQQIPWFSR
jgi:hypothetical protein